VEQTVTELYRAHVSFVERVLRRAGVADRDLADATQEVFLVVHRRLGDFEGRASPQTWLYRIAWNVASEYRRRAFRRRELLEDAQELADELGSPADLLEAQQSVSVLLDAIERLDSEKREALIGHELEEQPMITVARRLGIPLKTAFSRLYAARRALRLDLRKQGWACLPWWSWPFERIGTRVTRSRAVVTGWSLFAARGLLAATLVGLVPSRPIALHAAGGSVAHGQAAEAVVAVHSPVSQPLAAAAPARDTPQRRVRARTASSKAPSMPPSDLALSREELTVVRTGQIDFGRGPFGESPLAYPPLVEPHQHPRAKLLNGRERASDSRSLLH
jgi:RNA polymerase sigma-70 factor (ECF subfamily)